MCDFECRGISMTQERSLQFLHAGLVPHLSRSSGSVRLLEPLFLSLERWNSGTHRVGPLSSCCSLAQNEESLMFSVAHKNDYMWTSMSLCITFTCVCMCTGITIENGRAWSLQWSLLSLPIQKSGHSWKMYKW